MLFNRTTFKLSRRKFFIYSGLATVGTLLYSYFRGIRYPVLSWEPKKWSNTFSSEKFDATYTDLFHTSNSDTEKKFRAYAPEPKIQLSCNTDTDFKVSINNIAKDAKLVVIDGNQENITEQIVGITRQLTFSASSLDTFSLQWQLPELNNYSFAAIGDTGGDKELGWCIQRAHDLGARFLLHLGDFNYQESDYDNAIKLFTEAPIPCYISIGNHDFNESGLIYQQFLKQIGPLNNSFSIGKTRYINIDTAANFLPYSSGQRGKLLRELENDPTNYEDNVVFTHRPVHDPQPAHIREESGDHDIGSVGETKWLISSLKKIKATTLLSGHIHIFDRSTYQGIDNIIVGQGLGHQDLLVNNNDISKIALGNVDASGRVNYEFPSLKMPMESHCHPRVKIVKDSLTELPLSKTIENINASCNQDS